MSFDVFRTEAGDAQKLLDRRVHWIALLNAEKGEMLLKAPDSVKTFTKESLVTLLEIAEDLGCETVYVVLEKNHNDFATFSKSFMYFDFAPVDPNLKKFEKCMLFGCEL